MKNTLVAAAFAAILTVPALADPVFGTWKTIPDDNGRFGHIEIKQCGDTICGEMVASFEANGNKYKSDNLGKNIVWNMMLRKMANTAVAKFGAQIVTKPIARRWSWLTAATGLRLRAALQSSVVTAEHGRG
jgi:uncharacterized protein (DUF2147 family)